MAHPPVTLRAAGPEDLAELAALAASDAVAPFISFVAAGQLEEALADDAQEVLVLEHAGAFAGGARVVVRNPRSRISEVRTFMVRPDLRGRGVGAAGARAVAGHAFAVLGVHRLEAEVLGYNVAAVRTFEAAGFVREGVRRRAWDRLGDWQDGVLLGLLAEEHTAMPRSGRLAP